ncbi:unnamed protein product [Camellia sinensis]
MRYFCETARLLFFFSFFIYRMRPSIHECADGGGDKEMVVAVAAGLLGVVVALGGDD